MEGSGRKAPAVMLTSGHTHDAWRCTGAALGDCTGPLDNCTAPDSNAGGGGCPVTGGKCHGPKSKLGPFPANPGGYQLVLWNLVHKGFVVDPVPCELQLGKEPVAQANEGVFGG